MPSHRSHPLSRETLVIDYWPFNDPKTDLLLFTFILCRGIMVNREELFLVRMKVPHRATSLLWSLPARINIENERKSPKREKTIAGNKHPIYLCLTHVAIV